MFGTAKDVFLLFGDSITQRGADPLHGFGWVAALSNAYIRKLNVVNAGLSGYNTRQALSLLPQIIPPPEQTNVRFMVIFFGANDARFPNTGKPEQHVPIQEYRENLKKMIRHPSVQAHNPIIILMTPPPVDERLCERNELLKGVSIVQRKAEVVHQYAQTVRDVSKELNVALLDVWTVFMERATWREGMLLIGANGANSKPQIEHPGLLPFLLDGLHLTGDGNMLLYNALIGLIKEKWPEQAPAALPFVLPYWGDDEAWKDL